MIVGHPPRRIKGHVNYIRKLLEVVVSFQGNVAPYKDIMDALGLDSSPANWSKSMRIIATTAHRARKNKIIKIIGTINSDRNKGYFFQYHYPPGAQQDPIDRRYSQALRTHYREDSDPGRGPG